ncbi:helix-turn-helix transcriptional regulator [Sphingomonas sp. IW22]|jgi:AraC-like DNA-binding protein|uniref:helix-turn-helix transcriptional regulator n=1 Tax=Sphingomonas sp. IW22 TaxID=3242489 RepID=UPI003521EB6E
MPAQSRLIEGEFSPHDLFREAAALALCGSPAPEHRQQILSGQFRGWMWMEEVHPGLSGSACDLVTLSDAVIAQPIERSVMIGVHLHGRNGELAVEGGEAVSSSLEQSQIVGLGEARKGMRKLFPGDRYVRAGLIVRPSFLEHHGGAVAGNDLDLVDRLMSPGVHCRALRRCEIMIHLAKALVETPYTGSLGTLFRESTTTQMLFQALRLLRADEGCYRQLGKRHYDAVLHAQSLLDAALNAPPGTMALARQVGLNRNALQAGFKAVFGTTIFGYVREQRLRMARILIRDHGLGAAEAGYRVGFRSAAAFSVAFRRAFGHPPSQDASDTRH